MAAQTGTRGSQRWLRWGTAALSGLLSAGAAVAAGEVVAGAVRPASSPILVVGNRFVTLTPEWLKSFAIREFGTSDKTALLTGIYLTVGVLAVVIGLLTLRHIRYATMGMVLFGAVAIYCSFTTAAPHSSDFVPSAIATVVGLLVLRRLYRELPSTEPGDTAEDAPDRRTFLIGSAVTAGAALLATWIGKTWQHSRFSAAPSRAALVLPTPAEPAPALPANAALGSGEQPFDTSNDDFYRIDIALQVPQIEAAKWHLEFQGRFDHPTTLTLHDLFKRPMVERWITLACVSNEVGGDLIGTARFQGVLLAPLLRELGMHGDADQLLARGSDGATIGVPTAAVLDGRDAMLAVGMNGEPLPLEHGFPVRMVVPGLYGYVSACKWITQLTATTYRADKAYWVQRGWIENGAIELASRIDVPKQRARVKIGDRIAIAGVAWHQHVGISAVEVRIDDGPWLPAKLGGVPSTDTWRQWLLPWTVAGKGGHVVTVRAVDAQGKVQSYDNRPPYPGASSGWDTLSIYAE